MGPSTHLVQMSDCYFNAMLFINLKLFAMAHFSADKKEPLAIPFISHLFFLCQCVWCE